MMVSATVPRRPQRVLVVVPAWNEQDVISGVLAELREIRPDLDVLVVDDGSTDATSAMAAAAGAAVVTMPFNVGVGGAMRAGFLYAQRHGYDGVVQVDADGQHDPRHLEPLLEQLAESDVVIGSRFAGTGTYTVRGPRRWAMRLLAWSLSRLCRSRLSDVTSGFRASGPRAVPVFARYYPPEYLGDTVESLVVAQKAKLQVREVAVEMRVRAGGQPSHSPVKAAVYLLRALLVLVLAVIRSRPVSGYPMPEVPA
ncbi:MAG TPA: glycosyltransferase family 2 protein [Kineosporiaceae bacterium]|nr:glycosyltransferase family 2 protein [Kineosporiaceae bacterium]